MALDTDSDTGSAWQQPSEAAIHSYFAAMEPYWHPLAKSDELANAPLAAELLGRRLVLARLGGAAVALDDLCRHLGAPLSLGTILDGTRLRCGYHGWCYDQTGRCVDIPLRGALAIPEGARVRRYPTREAYGLVWVCLSETPRFGLPHYPEFEDPAFHHGPLVRHAPLRCSVQRMVMSALDDTHFPWVHDGYLGLASSPRAPQRAPEHAVWQAPEYLVSDFEVEMPVNPLAEVAASALGGNGAVAWENTRFVNFAGVNFIKNLNYSEAGVFVTWNVLAPVSYDHSLVFTRLSRTYDRDPDHDQMYEDYNLIIKDQDRAIIEGQRPWLLPPLSAHLALYIRPNDLPLIEYQKWMEELGIPQL